MAGGLIEGEACLGGLANKPVAAVCNVEGHHTLGEVADSLVVWKESVRRRGREVCAVGVAHIALELPRSTLTLRPCTHLGTIRGCR